MTKRECAIVMAYTDATMLVGDDLKHFHDYLKEIFGREIYTHEIPALVDEIKEKSKPDFIRLCAEAHEP